jgi:hypothetical protein
LIKAGFDHDLVMMRMTPRQIMAWMKYARKDANRDRAFAIEAAMLGARGDSKALAAKFRELNGE